MTLIGPRPEVPRFIPCYDADELEILTVRPGLTGPGQIFYTQVQQATVLDGEDPEQHYITCELHPKLAIDLDYVRRRGIRFDLLILIRTVLLLTKLGKPIAAPQQARERASASPSRPAPGGTAPSPATAAAPPQRAASPPAEDTSSLGRSLGPQPGPESRGHGLDGTVAAELDGYVPDMRADGVR
jgi:hypothetical protein